MEQQQSCRRRRHVGAFDGCWRGNGKRHASREHFEYSGLVTGQFYGTVACHGVYIVNKYNPGGKEIERCESKSPSGKLEGLTGAKKEAAQPAASPTRGIRCGNPTTRRTREHETGDFTYKVNAKDTKFKLVAIY